MTAGRRLERGDRFVLRVTLISVLLAAAIFAFDLSLPLGIAGGVPYVALVLAGLWFPAAGAVLVLAGVGSALTVIGYFWSEPAGAAGIVLVNRELALFAIWVVAILCFQRRQSEIALARSHDSLVTKVEDRTQALRQGERRLDLALLAARMGSYARDVRNNGITWDARAEAIYGLAPGSFDGSYETFLSVVHPDDRAHVKRAAEHAIHDGEDYDLEYRVVWPDRTVRHVSSRAGVIRDATGTPLQITGVVRDITERKQAEEALRRAHDDLETLVEERTRQLGQSEERYRRLVEHAPNAIAVHTEGRWTYLNAAAVALLGGQSTADLIGTPVIDFVHPDDRRAAAERMTRVLNVDAVISPTEVRCIRVDGGAVEVELVATKVLYARKPSIQLVMQDITQRKRAEESLKASEARLSGILKMAPEAIIATSVDGTVRLFSQGAERIFGYAGDEIVGKSLDLLIPSRFRASHQDRIEWFRRAAGNYRLMNDRREIVGLRKDGSEFPAEASVSKLKIHGETIFNVLLHDITEKRQAEAQLRQAQKMEAVGQLTGGIAHDFNNLLTVVLGNLELLREEIGENKRQQSLAGTAFKAAQRGAMLTARLLAFSRKQTLRPTGLDLAGLIAELSDLLRRTLGATIEIETETADDLWPAHADPAQVEGAILNLALNARDAMPDGGTLTIETANAVLDDEAEDAWADMAPGDYVQVAVADTGTGIPSAILEHVFEPFFTTKEVGKGSGLGLSMVYGFAKQSGGHVTIRSEENRGTTVKLFLPRAKHEDRRIGTEAVQGETNAGDKTILVVEDDPDVRALAVKLLGDLGYEVLAAGDGPSAIAAIRGRSQIDLLLTDVVLTGGMSGPELAREAQRVVPAMKILFTSGYPCEAVTRHRLVEDTSGLLNKPFRKAELARKVHEVFHKAA